jgi:hypothetical protein
VLVKVNELVFPADFVILDMAEDDDMPLILGRPFLATGRALIDVEMGQLMLRFHNEQVVFNIFETMTHRSENPKCYWIDVIEEIAEDDSSEPQPVQPKEKTIDKSTKNKEGVEDVEVKWCDKQSEASKEHMQQPLPGDILGGKYGGSKTLNKEKQMTAPTGPFGIFAYRRMPFGLRNASVTFQWCMLSIFSDTIEKTRRHHDKRLVRTAEQRKPSEQETFKVNIQRLKPYLGGEPPKNGAGVVLNDN